MILLDSSGDSTTICVVIIIILLGLPAFFSSSETALITVNKTRIRTLAGGGSKSTRQMTRLSGSQGEMLSTILIGNDMVDLPASSMPTVLTTEIFGNKTARAVTSVLTLLVLIFGEIAPKTMATLDAGQYPLRISHMIRILTTVLIPLTVFTNWTSLTVLKVLHISPDKRNDDTTEGELKTIVDMSHGKGVIESEEREMINSVFSLGDSVAKDVMVPRIGMVFVNIGANYNDLIQMFREEHYTRPPVYKETTDNVVDVINTEGLLLVEDKTSFCVSDYLRQSFYTFESKKLFEPIVEIKKSPNNIIIALDKYSATVGLVTLEDILEGIVGDIRDEYNKDEEEKLMGLGSGQHLVEGSMKLDDLSDILDLGPFSEDHGSVGGLVADRLEHLPSQDEEVVCDSVRLVVEQVKKNRIDGAHLCILPGEKEEEQNRGEIKAKQLIECLHFGTIYAGINRYDKK